MNTHRKTGMTSPIKTSKASGLKSDLKDKVIDVYIITK